MVAADSVTRWSDSTLKRRLLKPEDMYFALCKLAVKSLPSTQKRQLYEIETSEFCIESIFDFAFATECVTYCVMLAKSDILFGGNFDFDTAVQQI